MHFLLTLIIVLIIINPAPPVLLYAYYSRLNCAMLGVAMLQDVPRLFFVLGVFKTVAKNLASFV